MTMKLALFLVFFVAAFVFLMGFFPIVFYLIWSLRNPKKRRGTEKGAAGGSGGEDGQPQRFTLGRLKELRDNPRIRL